MFTKEGSTFVKYLKAHQKFEIKTVIETNAMIYLTKIYTLLIKVSHVSQYRILN